MKKLLLGTSALVGALVYSNAAQAQLEITIGGNVDFTAGFVQEDDVVGIDRRKSTFMNESDILFDVGGITDNGLEYGARIDLEADINEDADGEGLNASETSIFLSGDFGRVVLGGAIGAEETMRRDGSTIAYGNGGIDGNWYHFITWPAMSDFNVRPGLRLAHGEQDQDGIYSNATKITYFTPSLYGFQLGVSYTPDVGDRGQTFSGKFSGDAEEVISAGLTFDYDINDINLGLSILGETGDAESDLTNNVSDWGAGATISFRGLSFGAGYYDWENSFDLEGADSHSWNLGVSYDNEAWAASLGYLQAERFDNETRLLSISGEYRLGAGLTPFAEINLFDLDVDNPAIHDNDGEVYLIGTRLTF